VSGTSNGIVASAVNPYNRAMLDQPQIPVAQRTNPERSFSEEVRSLRLGQGEVFRGEGILAVTKAILQSGVAYVGG
jgi:indolepyruvate ferredoxin oxidoreductase alpha subunit